MPNLALMCDSCLTGENEGKGRHGTFQHAINMPFITPPSNMPLTALPAALSQENPPPRLDLPYPCPCRSSRRSTGRRSLFTSQTSGGEPATNIGNRKASGTHASALACFFPALALWPYLSVSNTLNYQDSVVGGYGYLFKPSLHGFTSGGRSRGSPPSCHATSPPADVLWCCPGHTSPRGSAARL
jgi:hypothetical protein